MLPGNADTSYYDADPHAINVNTYLAYADFCVRSFPLCCNIC